MAQIQFDAQRCNYACTLGATTLVDNYPLDASPDDLLDRAGNVCEWIFTLCGVMAHSATSMRMTCTVRSTTRATTMAGATTAAF